MIGGSVVKSSGNSGGEQQQGQLQFSTEEIIKWEQQKVQESWVPQAAKLKQLNQLHRVCEVWSSS